MIRLGLEGDCRQCRQRTFCICCLGFGVFGQHSIDLDMVAYDWMALCSLLHRIFHGEQRSKDRIFVSIEFAVVPTVARANNKDYGRLRGRPWRTAYLLPKKRTKLVARLLITNTDYAYVSLSST